MTSESSGAPSLAGERRIYSLPDHTWTRLEVGVAMPSSPLLEEDMSSCERCLQSFILRCRSASYGPRRAAFAGKFGWAEFFSRDDLSRGACCNLLVHLARRSALS